MLLKGSHSSSVSRQLANRGRCFCQEKLNRDGREDMSLKVTPSTITDKLEVESSNNTINTIKYDNYYNGTRGDVPEVSTTESRRNMFQQSKQKKQVQN